MLRCQNYYSNGVDENRYDYATLDSDLHSI